MVYSLCPFMVTDAFRVRSDSGEWKYFTLYEGYPDDESFDPATLGVWTGLVDMSGKHAYLGDFVRFADTDGNVYVHLLAWDFDMQCIMVGPLPYSRLHESGYIQPSRLEFEIVGNSFDNPDIACGVVSRNLGNGIRSAYEGSEDG